MTARIAAQLAPHQLAEFQRAARILLRSPLVTSGTPEAFALVRRWEQVLGNEFGQKLGYRLDVSRTSARLLRRPASLSSHRGARLPNGRQMSRWAYVYFTLVLAALEQPGQQVLASELLDRIMQRGRGDERLALDSREYVQRKAFSDAIRYLEHLGVLTVRDGDVDTIVDEGQVLFDVDRDAAAMCLVASPSILRDVTSVDDFIAAPATGSMESRRRDARQRLNRRLIDQAVVTVDDLDDDEYLLAWRNRRREADNISRLTGCDVELRAEGMALIDVNVESISGSRFPGNDSIAHAALLWLDRLVAAVTDTDSSFGDTTVPPESNTDDDEQSDDEQDGAVPFDGIVIDRPPTDAVRSLPNRGAIELWNEMFDEYGSRFAAAARERPDRFRAQCAELLARFDLVRWQGSQVLVVAAAARFRAVASVPAPRARDLNQQELFR